MGLGWHSLRASEVQEGRALVKWCNLNGIMIVHVPNESREFRILDGVRSGFPDYFFPDFVEGKRGLFIELKAIGGKVSAKQKWWIENLKDAGYEACVCFGWDEASCVIGRYFCD